MADNQAVKLTETWARAATETSRRERDYFVEAIRELQRAKEVERSHNSASRTDAAEQSD